MNGLGTILQSKNVRELLANLTVALKRIFRVAKVNYLMQCKDTIDLLR